MNLESLISHYGYLALMLGTFLEGETILVIAGLLAHLGYVKLPLVWLFAFLGTFIGDQLYFYIGRYKGRSFLEKRTKWQPKVARVNRYIDRYQNLLMLGFRFVYGIRTITPFALGMSRVSAGRYLLLNIISGVTWAIAIGTGGYYFGAALESILGKARNIEIYIYIGIIVIALGVAVIRFIIHRRNKNSDGN